MLGGTLFAAWGYLHGNIALSHFGGAAAAAAAGLLINVLFLVGLAGLCARFRRGGGGLIGAAGFVLGFAGAALDVAHGVHGVVSASGAATVAPWYAYVRAATGLPAALVGWLPWLSYGLMLVGIDSVRTGALGGWGTLPLAMGLFGWAYRLTDSGAIEAGFAHVLLGALYSLSWVVLGSSLWSVATERTARTTSRG